MCGICCILGPKTHQSLLETDCVFTKSRLSRRGPDCQSIKQIAISDHVDVLLFGSVLHLRGELTKQPCEDDVGNMLLWNGEVFGGLEISADSNDTQTLLELLVSCHTDQELLNTFAAIHGPWAFIYWQVASQRLWFGRDVLGRRSLLWHLPNNKTDVFSLSSIHLADMTMCEVPALGLYSLRCQPEHACEGTADQQWTLVLHEWMSTGQVPHDAPDGKAIADNHQPECSTEEDTSTHNLQSTSVIDTSVTNKAQHSAATSNSVQENSLSDNYRHDLLKALSEEVSFSSVSSHVSHHKKLISPIMYPMNRVLPSCDYSLPDLGDSDPLTYILDLLNNNEQLHTVCLQLMDVLERAVQSRVYNLPREKVLSNKPSIRKSLDSVNMSTSCDFAFHSSGNVVMPNYDVSCSCDAYSGADHVHTQAHVAVLFSGGLDSAVLAALADRCIPPGEPIDLLNVAFEQTPKRAENNVRRKKGMRESISEACDPFMVPDRISGIQALAELKTNRKWNFIQVNVTKDELSQYRRSAVSELLYPLCTVLDDSIGCAVWFAARGSGVLMSEQDKHVIPYLSTAKVVLVGMGADEQLAGYTRHRARFKQDGWPGLVDELELELSRIWCRNLGRDDRIISDHGRESRLPFLDEDVVSFLSNLPVHLKADLTLPRGIGEKLILRMCAAKLGLWKTAVLPKRAIQFGSRIAKMENSREKASDVCDRLKPDR